MTKFANNDTGAVSIDWIALAAGILLLGIIVVYSIFNNGAASLVSRINATLDGMTTDISVGTAPTQGGLGG